MEYSEIARQLCSTCHLFGGRRWCLATSGNFSARVDHEQFLISQSGREKSELGPDDLMLCKLSGVATQPEQIPSAETPLHACLYRLDKNIGAVLHTHSVPATVLSREAGACVEITGYEMQKALTGVSSHEATVAVPVFDNDQDMEAMAIRVTYAWREGRILVPGLLIRGHGLYAWGADIATARRHTEGFEFLFECMLNEGKRR